MPTIADLLYQPAVVDTIIRWADANGLPPLALLALGLQESDLNPYAAGDLDIGGSFGVFQIHLPAHGHTPQHWQGLDGLLRSMELMRDRWQRTFVQAGSWEAHIADIIDFQRRWSPEAQGSIAWSHEIAARRIGQALLLYVVYLKGCPSP